MTAVDKLGFREITSINELIEFWPLLLRTVKLGNEGSQEQLLRNLLSSVTDGMLVAVYSVGVLTAFCAATLNHTQDTLNILSLPTDGDRLGVCVLEFIKDWARFNNIKNIQIASEKLSGASFRYFEQTLGFRRAMMIFSIKV